MKVTFDSHNNSFVCDFEGESHTSIWAQVGSFQEVFCDTVCGKCKNAKTRFTTREAQDKKGKNHTYYELRCPKCGAKKRFGVHNNGKGTLFPHTKDDDGAFLPNNGWVKYNSETKKEE